MSLCKKILFYSVLCLAAALVLHPVLDAQTRTGSEVVNQGQVIFTYKSFPAETLKTNAVSFTVLGVPCYIRVSAAPKYVFGQADQDSTLITVTVEDTLHNAVQEAVSVVCATDLGTFPNGQASITLNAVNGKAETWLHSATVQNDRKTAVVTASAMKVTGGTISSSADVIMYPGAVTGTVQDGQSKTPLKGAIALVTDQSKQLVGADTTLGDGVFFIPLDKKVTIYHLQILVLDTFGDTVETTSDVDATTFPRPAEVIPNVIAGRLQFFEEGVRVPGAGVVVYLDSIPRASGSIAARRSLSSISTTHMRELVTDEKGRFKFGGLPPAFYRISTDTAKIRNAAINQIIADTTAGTFTINLNFDVAVDSVLDLRMNAQSAVTAGDTLTYTVAAANPGSVIRFNAALIDTLPAQTAFVSMRKGTFTSARYDSARRIMTWSIDTLAIGEADSASVTVVVARNIQDSTVIRNKVWYTSAGETIQFSAAAATLVRALPGTGFASYFSGRDSVAAGDSVLKVYTYRNTGADSLRGITIADTLHGAGRSAVRLAGRTGQAIVSIADSVILIAAGTIGPGMTDTVMVTIATDAGLAPGSRISSNARMMRYGIVIDSAASVLPIIDRSKWTTPLSVVKTANKKVAEIGDVVTYQIRITNSSAGPLHAVGIYDLLPHAFTYVKNSARWNGRPLEPSPNPAAEGLTWAAPDTLGGGGTAALVYQLALGADALQSQGMNTATASGETRDGLLLVSAPSQWQVTVKAGVFTEKGLLIGKVFYDDDRNTFQSEGENGIKDVELWMEDGTRITTGDGGKYSVPELKPGQHVVRVNERTLPPGTELMAGQTDFADDPVSRFVRLTSGGIAKANFFVKRNLSDSLALTAARALRSSAIREAVPKYVFKGTNGKRSADTVEMIVSFTYKGEKFLQRIEVRELVPAAFRYVDKSATFNGRRFDPVIEGDSLLWRLGRAGSSFSGSLRYKMTLRAQTAPSSVLRSSSVVSLMTADSVLITSVPLATENVVKEIQGGEIASSEEAVAFVLPASAPRLADSTVIQQGDEMRFSSVIRIDAHQNPRSVLMIDTLDRSFAIDERSFMLNGVPLQSGLASVRSPRGADAPVTIASVDLTNHLRSGRNVVSYIARIERAGRDTVFTAKSRMEVVDRYGERRAAASGAVVIIYRGGAPEILNKEKASAPRDAARRTMGIASPPPKSIERDLIAAAAETHDKHARDSIKAAVRKLSSKIRADKEPVPVQPPLLAKRPPAPEKSGPPDKIQRVVDAIPKPPASEKLEPDRAGCSWMVYRRTPGLYRIQISSWASKEKAEAIAQRFSRTSGRETSIQEHLRDGKIFFAVQFGRFKTYQEARAVVEEQIALTKRSQNSKTVKIVSTQGRKKMD